MKSLCRRAALACVAAFLAALPASALTRDEILQLVKAGVGDSVIVGKIKADGARYDLSVQDLLDLKKAGVGDSVMEAMVASGRPAAPALSEPRPVSGRVEGDPAACHAGPADAEGRGTLAITNLDERPWSLQIDEPGRFIFYYYGTAGDRVVVSKGETRTVSVPAGVYRVRWVGAAESFEAPVKADQTTKIVTSAVKRADIDAVQVSVAAGDREVASGTLRTFSEAPPAPPAPVVVQAPAPAPAPQPVYVYETVPVYTPAPSTVVWYEPSYCRPGRSYVHYSSWDCGPTVYRSYGTYSSDCAPGGRIGANTVVGAGLGAIIGHRSRHIRAGGGAAIGAAAGYLLDNFSRCR